MTKSEKVLKRLREIGSAELQANHERWCESKEANIDKLIAAGVEEDIVQQILDRYENDKAMWEELIRCIRGEEKVSLVRKLLKDKGYDLEPDAEKEAAVGDALAAKEQSTVEATDMPWCEHCNSYHATPKSKIHYDQLKCRRPWRDWFAELNKPPTDARSCNEAAAAGRDKVVIDLPTYHPYVRFPGGSCLRWVGVDREYRNDSGSLSVKVSSAEDLTVISAAGSGEPPTTPLIGERLEPCTEEEWNKFTSK